MPKSIRHPAFARNRHVIGIDSALLRIGFGRYYKNKLSGCFFDTTELAGARLVEIHDAAVAWAHKQRTLPDLAVIEGYSYDSEGKVFQLGEAGGVIRLALTNLGIPYIEVPPSSLKLFVTGDGSACKEHVIKDVAKFYGYETDDDNVADAIGLTVWGVVKLTKLSKRRCELQAIKNLETPKRRARVLRPSKETTI